MKNKLDRPKNPKILLYGMFSDIFLEGVDVLGYDCKLSGFSNLKNVKSNVDIVLFGSDCDFLSIKKVLSQLEAVPIVMSGMKGFTEFNPLKETGDCFKYKRNSPYHQLEALIKATECYRYPYDWKNVLSASKDVVKYMLA